MILLEFINRMKASISGPKFKSVSKAALKKSENRILQNLRANSPRDTGEFASNWRTSLQSFSNPNELASLIISNNTKHYGIFLQVGAEPGKAPWYFPLRHRRGKRRGQMKSGTGKLKLSDGRVWAGGLNPGHDKTIGGAVQHAFSEKSGILKDISIDVANGIIKVFV